MPNYDRKCESCGWEAIDLVEPVNHPAPLCPDCGEPTVRAWLTRVSSVIGDEMDHWQVNGTRHPIHFTSKQDRRRWLKQTGQRECAYHVGADGSDKSPHTTRWAAMDAYTLKNAQILLERAAAEPTRNEPKEAPLHVTVTTGDYHSQEFKDWRYGR